MAIPSIETLQTHWRNLNVRYFDNRLPPIPIVWSRRLTSSVGMFASRGGPRSLHPSVSDGSRREIRLSRPLLERLAERTPYAEQELLNTLAHEMIHQWQFDILKRRPNHGMDFLRKMTEMNRSGDVAITTYHSLQKEVLALSPFAWRCKNCGQVYRRQRKTIKPRRHQCGNCRGTLQELGVTDIHRPSDETSPQTAGHSSTASDERPAPRAVADKPTGQLTLEYSFSGT
ncbi:MAG: SprT-like domain-containing protein [Nitrospira sp.]|nr:SprT-like domain-containing protein [Nitrospira sp.]